MFVSSTFADMKAERDLLQRDVFPQLRQVCASKGLRFQAIDLRWGVSEEAGRHNRTMQICLRELERCQQGSLKPNFLVLLGDRYGWRPLPEVIAADLFERLKALVADPKAITALAACYRLDENALPPEYVLQPRSGELAPYDAWNRGVEGPLLAALERAATLLLASDALTEDQGFRIKSLNIGISATHHEIIRGALTVKNAREHVHVFVRSIRYGEGQTPNPEFTEPQPERLRELVEGLAAHVGERNVHRYPVAWHEGGRFSEADLGAFRDEALESLARVIQHQIDNLEGVSSLEQESEAHEVFGRERHLHFRGREETLRQIDSYLGHGAGGPLAVVGATGSGKSALMARAVQQARSTHPRALIVERYAGATSASSARVLLLKDVVQQIRHGYPRPSLAEADLPEDLKGLSQALHEAMRRATADRPMILFLDGLNQLGSSGQGRQLTWLPTAMPGQVHMVVSCATPPEDSDPADPRDEVFHALTRKIPAQECIVLEALSTDDGSQLLGKWLGDTRRKLQPGQRDAVLRVFARHGNPLWLKVAAAQGAVTPSWKALPELPERTEEMISVILRRMCEPGEHGEALVSHTLQYLACARHGLAEDELMDILSGDREVMEDFHARFPQASELTVLPVNLWVVLRGDLAPYLAERLAGKETLLSFYHQSFLDGVSSTFLRDNEGIRERHEGLAKYFFSLSDTKRIGADRLLDELPWQLAEAGEWGVLASLLSEAAVFRALFLTHRSDAKSYWTLLEKNTSFRMPQAYAEVIRDPGSSIEVAICIADLLDETAYRKEAEQLLIRLEREYSQRGDGKGRIVCLGRLGLLQMSRDDLQQSERTFRECAQSARAEGDTVQEAQAWLNLANLLSREGRLEEAGELVDRFLESGLQDGRGRAFFFKAVIMEKRGAHREVEALLEEARQFGEAADDSDLLGEVLQFRGNFLISSGRVAVGERDLLQAAAHFERTGTVDKIAQMRTHLGVLKKDRGDLTAALDEHQRAAELNRRLGRRMAEAGALDNQAEALIRMARYDEALPLNQQAVEIFRQSGAKRDLSIALLNRSAIHRGQGEVDAALDTLRESRTLADEIGDVEFSGRALLSEAGVRRDSGQYQMAENLTRKALQALNTSNTMEALALGHFDLGWLLYEHLGRQDDALAEFDEAIQLGIRRDMRSWVVNSLGRMATLYASHGDFDVALQAAQEAHKLAGRYRDRQGAMSAALLASEFLFQLHQLDESATLAEEALREAQSLGAEVELAWARMQMGVLLREKGEAARSLECVSAARSYFQQSGNWSPAANALALEAQVLCFDLHRIPEAAAAVGAAMKLAIDHHLGGDMEKLKHVRDAILAASGRHN